MSDILSNVSNDAQKARQEAQGSQVDHPAAAALHGAQAKLAMKTSEILTGYHDRLAAIRDDDKLEESAYADVLSDQQKTEIIQTRKREAADKLFQETREGYEAAFDSFSEEATRHADGLRSALFGLGDAGAAVLSQAVNADEGKLLEMVRLGKLTGTTSMARAALASAITRGDAPTVVHDYLQRFPEDEPLLRAFQQAPDAGWIEERRARIDTLLKPATADQLTSRPSMRSFG
jgi:hypothetical protein